MGEPEPQSVGPSAARSTRAVVVFIGLFVVLLAGDLALKSWSFGEGRVPPNGVRVAPGVLALRLTENRGAIFGSMQGRKWFFVVASVAAAGMILYFFWQSRPDERLTHIALALILSGAMGNLYDRLTRGVVRDMLWLFPEVKLPFGWRWPGGADDLYPWIFNLADVFLLVGIGLILLRSLWAQAPGERCQESQAADGARPTRPPT